MSYTQHVKNQAREKLLVHAVTILTEKRNEAPCLRGSYVRDLRYALLSDEESPNAREAQIIDDEYICAWENLRRSCVGQKSPKDLRVCYLGGPEPMNDFTVLKGLGVQPQNIWAFESSKTEFTEALRRCCGAGFDQPKLIKMKVENFLESVPMSFDIVYLDFCSSFISSKNSMRCVANLFRHHRLCSPGVLITNFCDAEKTKTEEYVEAIARYYFIKKNTATFAKGATNAACIAHINEMEALVEESFEHFYGNFITDFICNIPSVIVPAQRFAESALLSFFVTQPSDQFTATESVANSCAPDLVFRFLLCNDPNHSDSPLALDNSIMQRLSREISSKTQHSPLDSLSFCIALRDGMIPCRDEIKAISSEFTSTHRFLDRPCESLYFDFAMRQLSYPMHCNPTSSIRLSYIAKSKRMYADALVFDDCRYIYDWLPAALQGTDPLKDKSWLYVFRLALDGLVKCRMGTNSDYFYRGSVIHDSVPGFGPSDFSDRDSIV